MIEPYATALNSCTNRFSEIGFTKSNDTDYAMTFSNGSYTIEISTEKYYHPSITTRLLDGKGGKYSMRIVREIFAPEQLAKDSSELNTIKHVYHLDDASANSNLREKGTLAYSKLAIEQLVNFLHSYKKELFSETNSFQAEYAKREIATLLSLGL